MNATMKPITDEHQRVTQSDAALRDAVHVAKTLEKSKGAGLEFTYELSADPRHRETFERMHSEYGGSTAAAVVATMNEMARESGNRFVTNWGEGLPTSFDDVRGTYGGYASDPRVNPDIRGEHLGNVGRVKSVRGASSAPAVRRPDMDAPGARAIVEGKQAEQEGKGRVGKQAQKDFDKKNEITIGPDGRPHSGNSETMKVLKGAGSDSLNMVDTMVDAIGGSKAFNSLSKLGDILKPKK